MKKTIIIDASVVAKWLLPDENNLIADIIKKAFANREIAVAIPSLIFYEINNLLKSAVLSKRISAKDSVDFYESFLNLNFTILWSKELLKNTLQKALDLNISSYDASYVALAEYLNIPFYTADEKLVEKIGSRLVLPIKVYPTPDPILGT